MQPYTFVMHPVGNSQMNPFFTQQMVNPANPQVSYQVNLQFRQYATLTMNPPFNPHMMHPLNTCPFPSVNPQITPSLNPRMISNVNPQLIGPVASRASVNLQLISPGSVPSINQQIIQGRNLSVVNPQQISNVNRFPVPSLNCPPLMSVRASNISTVNLSQPIPNLNTQMMTSINSQSFHSVNSQNIHSPLNHIPAITSRAIPHLMSQTIQAVNPPSYSQNVRNVNYPNMPIINPQTVMTVREQTSLVNSRTVTPDGRQTPLANSQIDSPIEEQSNTPSENPENFLPSADPQNVSSSVSPQTFPSSVNPQENPNTEPNAKPKVKKPRNKSHAKKKTAPADKKTPEKKKNRKGVTIFWVDPAYKKSKPDSGKSNENSNENNTVLQTNGLDKPKEKMPQKDVKSDDKKEGKKVETLKPNKLAPDIEASKHSNTNSTPLITIKAKDDKPLDEKKTEYFKNLRSSRVVPGRDHVKRKLSENDKTKAKILKIFALMQKLKGVSKKLWQNVAANGEFKDNPSVPEEVTKFLILSHKFVCEVDCIVKLTKKEGPSSHEKPPKDDKTKPKDSNEDSNKDQTSKTSKQAKQRKNKTVPVTVKLLLKKLDVLDALGLCFVNINGIFIKRYCSVILKLRKSLNALLDKSKTSSRKKRLKIPRQPCLPRCGAIMLTCYGSTTYAKALHLASKNIKFKSLGIQCIKKRRSVTGGLILEVFADEDYEKKTEKLAEKLQEIYASLEIRVTRPQKYGDLVITRLEPSVTIEQICEQLAKLGNCSVDVFKTGSRGKTCIWVRCPLNIAIQLDQKTIEMKSKVARINLKAKKFVRCYKCFNIGHIKELCPSHFDHNNMCFKCGLGAHEARTCQNAPRCLTCQDNSLPSCHRLGGEKCPSAIPKFIKWPANDGTQKNMNGNPKKKGKGCKGKNVNKKKIQTPSISNIKPTQNQVRSRN